MRNARHPAARPASTSLQRSPAMKLADRSMPCSSRSPNQHPGPGFSAIAAVRAVVITDVKSGYRQVIGQEPVDPLNRLYRLRSPGDVRLVCHHDPQESRRRKQVQRLADAGKDFDLAHVIGRMRHAVAHDRAIDDAVTVEENSGKKGIRVGQLVSSRRL